MKISGNSVLLVSLTTIHCASSAWRGLSPSVRQGFVVLVKSVCFTLKNKLDDFNLDTDMSNPEACLKFSFPLKTGEIYLV